MFAVLGEIEFKLGSHFDSFSLTTGAEFAEHARINQKPGLQFVGNSLNEMQVSLLFHHTFCDVKVSFEKLNTACKNHQALAFVLGNGEYLGFVVITALSVEMQLMSASGAMQAMSVSLTLREFVGDAAQPLKPPAVAGNGAGAVSPQKLPGLAFGENLKNALQLASQAKSALHTASNASRIARQMKNNPVAAFGRVAGLVGSIGEVISPLSKSLPYLQTLTDKLPQSIQVIRAAAESTTMLHRAQSTLGDIKGSGDKNLPFALDSAGELIGSAMTTFNNVSPQLSGLSAKSIIRQGSE